MYYIDWGLFALGLFIGIVGTVTAVLAFVVVDYVNYELFKDIHATRACRGETEGEDGRIDE